MKSKGPKRPTKTLSDKIADALTVKPRADIEDDQVFGTKPKTVSRVDFNSSDSEDESAISDFRKRNVNLLSEINKKYEGQVVSKKDIEDSDPESSVESDDVESDADGDDETLPAKETKSKVNGINTLTSIYDPSSSDEDNDNTNKSKQESYSEDDSDGESDDYSITKLQKKSSQRDERSDEEDDVDDDEGEGYDISQLEEPMQEEFEHVKKQNVSEEAKKGGCVRNQLLLWEGLLEMRIHLQRCVNTANQMPLPETHEELKGNSEFVEENNTAKANVATALDKLLTLQNMLLRSFPETKTISNTKKSQKDETEIKPAESDEEIPSDTDDEEIPSDTENEDDVEETKPIKHTNPTNKKRKLDDYEKDIATTHKAFKTFRDSTIQKWNDKTRVATAANIKNTPTNTILQQISYILSDKNKLVRRTQLKRTEYDIVGYKKEPTVTENGDQNESVNPVMRDRKDGDEYIPEIFDDNDFYHQLLRELIECKSADISDPVQLSRQWIALQQMRSKMKRKVDTKATKGRKIKYVVHNQLVNFMAPERCTKWTEEATNELFSSVFGKLFEQNNLGINGNFVSGLRIKE